MKVLLRQSISLYGVDYSVGLREIPEGHACGDAWDIYVKAGWIIPQVKPAEPEAVAAEAVVEVEPEAKPDGEVVVDAVSETAEVEAEPEAVAEVSTRKKK